MNKKIVEPKPNFNQCRDCGRFLAPKEKRYYASPRNEKSISYGDKEKFVLCHSCFEKRVGYFKKRHQKMTTMLGFFSWLAFLFIVVLVLLIVGLKKLKR